MLFTVSNALLVFCCLFLGACSAQKSKGIEAPAQETVNPGEIVDEAHVGPIVSEYFAPNEIVPESVAISPPPAPLPVPAPVPIIVPVVLPDNNDDDDDDEECPPVEPVPTGERCVEPDHFLSYPFSSPSVLPEGLANLDDQFIEPIDVVFGDIQRLLNPATKIHNGLEIKAGKPNTHYLAVGITVSQNVPVIANRQFAVANQFGRFTLNVPDDLVVGDDGSPVLELLVPSLKSACPGNDCIKESCPNCFPDGDHFLCYELTDDVEQNRCPIGDVQFNDQFLNNKIVDSLVPKRFCNPVKKTFNSQVSAASSEATNHLVCYEGTSTSTAIRSVKMLNQLGLQEGSVEINDEICVPSRKIEIIE
jgi:hypothetical protein